MSDAMQVFLESDDIPDLSVVMQSMRDEGLVLEEWDEADSLNDIEGFWPGKYKGKEAGFEFCIDDVDDDDLEAWEVDRSELEGRDVMIELCYSTDQDLVATVLFISFICESCNGITFNEHDELAITSANAKRWKNESLVQLI